MTNTLRLLIDSKTSTTYSKLYSSVPSVVFVKSNDLIPSDRKTLDTTARLDETNKNINGLNILNKCASISQASVTSKWADFKTTIIPSVLGTKTLFKNYSIKRMTDFNRFDRNVRKNVWLLQILIKRLRHLFNLFLFVLKDKNNYNTKYVLYS